MANKCKQCNKPITWANQQKQFFRLIVLGLSEDQAKARMPMCSKCITAIKTAGGMSALKNPDPVAETYRERSELIDTVREARDLLRTGCIVPTNAAGERWARQVRGGDI